MFALAVAAVSAHEGHNHTDTNSTNSTNTTNSTTKSAAFAVNTGNLVWSSVAAAALVVGASQV